MSYSSGDEDYDCPLCMEEFDLEDRNFRPCPCGYQICRFCWHHIREDLNGRCPACRRIYSEETVEFTPVTPDQRARIKREKKEKERQAKEIEAMNRKHLANMRVVQKNLVYIIGLNPRYANEETLRQLEYFGQYGKIAKIVVNKRNPPPTTNPGAPPSQPSVGVYITFHRKEDAAKAIAAVDGSVLDGRILRASYGTTKYCTYYLRNMACQNPGCMYLHEPGEDADSYTKEDLAIGKHHLSGHGPSTSETGQKASVLGNGGVRSGPNSSSLSIATSGSHRKVVESGSLGKSLISKPDSRPSAVSSVSSSSNNAYDEDDRPALPPTASWASWTTKPSSNPSTPTIKNTALPERAATPESFGPPLAVAVAIGNQKKHPQTSKRKHEQHGKGSTESVSLIEKKEEVEIPTLHMNVQTDSTANKTRKEIQKEIPPASIDLPTAPATIATTNTTTTSVSSAIPSVPASKRPLKPHRNDSEGLVQYVLGTVVNEADIPSSDPTTSSDTVSEVGSEDTLPTSFSSSSSGNLPPPNDFTSSLSNISSLVSALPTANNYMGLFNPFNENTTGSSATTIPTSAQEYFTSFDPFQESFQSSSAGPPMSGGRSRATSRFGFAQDFLSRQVPAQGFGHGHLPTYTAQPPNQGLAGLIPSGTTYLQRDLDSKTTNDGLRALLPNANINFSGDASRIRSQQWNSLESDSIMQEHDQRHPILNSHHFGEHVSYPNTVAHHGLSDTERQQYGHYDHQGVPVTTGVKAPPPGIGLSQMSPGVGHPISNWGSAPFGHRYGEVLTDNSAMSMGFMGEPGKPREDAQNFFGQFLKRAAQANATIDGPGQIVNVEKDPLPGIPFQDPAIMSVRMSPSVASPSSSRVDVSTQPQLHNATISKSTGHRLSVFERLRDKTDDSPITVSGTTGTIVDLPGSGKQEYGPSHLPRNFSSFNAPSNTEQERTTQASLSLESRTDQYMADSTEKNTLMLDSHVIDNDVRKIVNKDTSLSMPILEKHEDNIQSINFQEVVGRTSQPKDSIELEHETALKVPQQSDQAITTPSGNGKKKKKGKSRSASPSEDGIEYISSKLNNHSALKQSDEQAMTKTLVSSLSEGNPNQVNLASIASTVRDDSSEVLDSPSSMFTSSVGLNFNTPISSAFDGILNSRDCPLSFPPFNPPLTGSHFWATNFQQPSSSIPELEREIESARKEAAMLNVKLQAAIRKNQAFATGW